MARKDIMLAMPYDRKRVRKWGRDFYVQPKLDGIRCRELIQANKVTLVKNLIYFFYDKFSLTK